MNILKNEFKNNIVDKNKIEHFVLITRKNNMHIVNLEQYLCDLFFLLPDILTLANSVHELTKASRYARSGMYNAMQATLLCDLDLEKKIVETSDDPVLVIKRIENQKTAGISNLSNNN